MKNKAIYINFIFSAIGIIGIFFSPGYEFNLFQFIFFCIFIFIQVERIIDMYKKNEKGILLISRLSLLITSLLVLLSRLLNTFN